MAFRFFNESTVSPWRKRITSSHGERIRERNVWWRLFGQILWGLGLLMVLPFVIGAFIPVCIMILGDHLTDESAN